jgi:hypothetical protein
VKTEFGIRCEVRDHAGVSAFIRPGERRHTELVVELVGVSAGIEEHRDDVAVVLKRGEVQSSGAIESDRHKVRLLCESELYVISSTVSNRVEEVVSIQFHE